MNVFEDLLVELKEENLLENTFVAADKQAKSDVKKETAAFEIEILDEISEDELASECPTPKQKRAKPNKEYYYKRAVDEVASLQMVEHVLTGVEREIHEGRAETVRRFQCKEGASCICKRSRKRRFRRA